MTKNHLIKISKRALLFSLLQMVLLYRDPHGKFLTESTITHSVKDTGIKLSDFTSQTPGSRKGGHAITQEANIDMSPST